MATRRARLSRWLVALSGLGLALGLVVSGPARSLQQPGAPAPVPGSVGAVWPEASQPPEASHEPSPSRTPAGSLAPSTASSPLASSPTARIASARPPRTSDRFATPEIRRALQARLDDLRERYAIPGISVTIIFPDGTRWVGSSGLADVEAGREVNPKTKFAVASVSKTFTAALIMALEEDGKVALDATVRSYLPELAIDPAITVRQLLDHTSGLNDFFFDRRIDKALLSQPARRWDPAESLTYVGKPYFKPGRGWHYSNTNYLVLGMLAERVGGAPLSDQLHERFLGPLGLAETSYQPSDEPADPLAHGYRFASPGRTARPIDLSDGSGIAPFTSVITAAAGAGGIASNSQDLAVWTRQLYGGHVLEPASLQAMILDAASTARFRPRLPYGLGVQLIDFAGEPSLGHTGRLLGFRSLIRYLPRSGMSIAVLTNQSRTDPGIVGRSLMAIALGSIRRCPCPEPR